MNIQSGDLLDVTSGVIVHGVNCQGAFGAGIAKQIKRLYPEVCSSYLSVFREYGGLQSRGNPDLLGHVQYCYIDSGLVIVNAFTQLNYGGDGRKYVSYDAVDRSLQQIAGAFTTNIPIHLPKIGCGLAGGEWNVVKSIIEHRLSDFDVTIWVKD